MVHCDRHLELAVVDLLEEVATAARAPQLELGIVVRRESEDDQVGADLGATSSTTAAAPAIESVGDAEQCRELSEPFAVVVVQRGEALLRRARIAAPVMADERGEERDL